MADAEPTDSRALARLEARMLVRWVAAELDKLGRGEINEAEAADHIAAHAWAYRVGCVVAERTDTGS